MRTTHISTNDIKRRVNIHLFEDINTLIHKPKAIEMRKNDYLIIDTMISDIQHKQRKRKGLTIEDLYKCLILYVDLH